MPAGTPGCRPMGSRHAPWPRSVRDCASSAPCLADPRGRAVLEIYPTVAAAAAAPGHQAQTVCPPTTISACPVAAAMNSAARCAGTARRPGHPTSTSCGAPTSQRGAAGASLRRARRRDLMTGPKESFTAISLSGRASARWLSLLQGWGRSPAPCRRRAAPRRAAAVRAAWQRAARRRVCVPGDVR